MAKILKGWAPKMLASAERSKSRLTVRQLQNPKKLNA